MKAAGAVFAVVVSLAMTGTAMAPDGAASEARAASFMVQCSAVPSDRTVTITAGNASIGFDLTQ